MRKLFPIRAKDAVEALRVLPRLLDADKLDEAEALLERAREEARHEGWGHAHVSFNLSFVQYRQGRLEAAYETLTEALAQIR